MLIIVWISLLAVLQVGDLWTTHKVLSQGGYEQNPAMRWVLDRFGFVGMCAVKAAMLGIIILAAVLMPGLMAWLLPLLVAIYAFVVWHNWRQLE